VTQNKCPEPLVVVPTLGSRPEWLDACLRSLTTQSRSVDVVVVGPGGATKARDLAHGFGVRWETEAGSGLSAAVNQIWRSADNEYLAWLGDDDLLTPDSVHLTSTALTENRLAVLAYGHCRVIDAQGATSFFMRPGRLAPWLMRYGADYLPQPGTLVRASAAHAVGLLDERLRYAMDLDLFLKLRRQGSFAYLPFELAAFRRHETSLTVSNPAPDEEARRVRSHYLSPAALRLQPVWAPPIAFLGRAWGKLQTLDRRGQSRVGSAVTRA
jgi:GT2 family glycosyltransferase